MASLTISIISALGTSTKTLTFSGPDATRILTAYQNKINPSGTQDDLVAWLSKVAQTHLNQLINLNETVRPTPPTMT